MRLTLDDFHALRQQLIAHEGLRLKPYMDTAGKLTIGVGRNLSDVSITSEEAYDLLDHDVERTVNGVLSALPWTQNLTAGRFRVLVDIAFNTGLDGLLKFHKMLAAARAGEYEQAALEVERSQLAPNRARRLAMLMRGISKDLQ